MRIHHDLEVYALPGQLLLQPRHISEADIQKFVRYVSEICSTFGVHLVARGYRDKNHIDKILWSSADQPSNNTARI